MSGIFKNRNNFKNFNIYTICIYISNGMPLSRAVWFFCQRRNIGLLSNTGLVDMLLYNSNHLIGPQTTNHHTPQCSLCNVIFLASEHKPCNSSSFRQPFPNRKPLQYTYIPFNAPIHIIKHSCFCWNLCNMFLIHCSSTFSRQLVARALLHFDAIPATIGSSSMLSAHKIISRDVCRNRAILGPASTSLRPL